MLDMFDKSQLMRGTLEGCILKIISSKETYGYEIIEQLVTHGFTDIKEGTLYPLLVRLNRKELIKSELRPSSLGPKRKYYSITNDGLNMLNSFNEAFNEVYGNVKNIMEGTNNE
jgi:PadR family transcriptional regulator PadR